MVILTASPNVDVVVIMGVKFQALTLEYFLAEDSSLRSMADSPQQPSSQAPAAHTPGGPGGVQIGQAEDAGPPRPIGGERGHKRGSTPNYPEAYLSELDSLGNHGLWGYNGECADVQRDVAWEYILNLR